MKHHDVNEHWVTTPPLLRHVGAHGCAPTNQVLSTAYRAHGRAPLHKKPGSAGGAQAKMKKGLVPFLVHEPVRGPQLIGGPLASAATGQ